MKKILKQEDWLYTLYEDEIGQYVLEVVVPASKGAWASYEKTKILSEEEKAHVIANPRVLDLIVDRIRAG